MSEYIQILNLQKQNNFNMKRLLYIAIILLASAICLSCNTTHYVPVETKVHDTTYINKVQVDSIFDSTFVYVKGDTVIKYKYLYKYKMLHDTVYVNRTDSIQVPYPVERELSWWENFKMEAGGYAVILSLAAFVFLGIKLFINLYKK